MKVASVTERLVEAFLLQLLKQQVPAGKER
jgi:hypothetical protein